MPLSRAGSQIMAYQVRLGISSPPRFSDVPRAQWFEIAPSLMDENAPNHDNSRLSRRFNTLGVASSETFPMK